MSDTADNRVRLAHGGGGELMNQLIRDHIVSALENETLSGLGDGAVLPAFGSDVVFTTDSYVVTPLEFPGGNIGRLAVAGTVNDLAVMGAEPVALSLGLILEEGLSFDTLDRILATIAETAKEAGIPIVTGDTKVIERRGNQADGMFINTAGIGRMRPGVSIDLGRANTGDAILVSGPIAEHGLAIMAVRNGIEFDTDLRTDAAPLAEMIGQLIESGVDIRFMRDATRGGISGVLADISETTGKTVEIEESRIPITPPVRHAAEMLGLDPLSTANEGKIVLVVPAPDADKALSILHAHKYGQQAGIIGTLTDASPAMVEMVTRAGGRRVVQRPYGEDLPRIC